ncbi:radical SAM protein [Candidatus Woesearchaeota archaeon]|nr:radical SAM protein [Candidatus Woesearchaeota archaeon]
MKKTWFGRCVFIGWYCEKGTCKFCYRSTTSHKKKHAKKARRSMASMIADAIIGKNLGWKFEYLTGGYANRDIEDIKDISKHISEVYKEKIWVNLGILDEKDMNILKPYVDGICASIETTNIKLHNKLCPDKPIQPYSEMLKLAKNKGFKTSITIVIGLGETKQDLKDLLRFIKEHRLDRITFYALKPVKGTDFENISSPDIENYSWWIKETKKAFPDMEIMAGLTPKKVDYVKDILKAGADGITKFPAISQFNSEKAKLIEKLIKQAGREFISTLTSLPNIDWNKEVDNLDISVELNQQIKEKLKISLKQMKKR